MHRRGLLLPRPTTEVAPSQQKEATKPSKGYPKSHSELFPFGGLESLVLMDILNLIRLTRYTILSFGQYGQGLPMV